MTDRVTVVRKIERVVVRDATRIPGGSGSAITGYEHTQSTPAQIWIVHHNLARAVVVTVYDAFGNEIDYQLIRMSTNTLHIVLTSPLAGSVTVR
jgi:hypothetical protein